MSHVFPRSMKVTVPPVLRGDGVYLFDHQGKTYLDGCGGAAVSCLGHSNARVIAAIQKQMEDVSWAHTSFFTSQAAEDLADLLIAHAPDHIEKVYFVSGGSEATEAAIKLARQYFLEQGETQRIHIIARRQSYHGNTLGALSAGGNEFRRAQFAPLLSVNMHHVDPCHYWRWANSGESAFDYGQRMAQSLEDKILELGADTVCAFMAEPVVGATMGAVPAVEGYFKKIREICDRYGVLLILDEVMCGMGRTGTLFASEQEGIFPDIVCIAKGLGAGYQPIGAMLCSGKIYDTIAQGSGFFQHGHTYLGHPLACAAGGAVLREILERNLLQNVQDVGGYLGEQLCHRFGQHPFVGDIRGRGLFWGLEFVEHRDSKTPFDPALKLHARLKAAAFEAGAMIYPMGGSVDGKLGDHILLAPPFIFERAHVDELLDKLTLAMERVFSEVRA